MAAGGRPHTRTAPLTWPVAKQSPRSLTQAAHVAASASGSMSAARALPCSLPSMAATATTHWHLRVQAFCCNIGAVTLTCWCTVLVSFVGTIICMLACRPSGDQCGKKEAHRKSQTTTGEAAWTRSRRRWAPTTRGSSATTGPFAPGTSSTATGAQHITFKRGGLCTLTVVCPETPGRQAVAQRRAAYSGRAAG